MLTIDIAVTRPKRDFNISQKDTLGAAARGISKAVIRRLRERNRHTAANRNGLPKSNYYAQASDSLTTVVSGTEAEVQIRQPGIALHWKGGTVRPKPGKKALAIPVDPAVAGIWPSEYSRDHELVTMPGGSLRDAKTGDILYILLPKVTIPADKTVLPTDEKILSEAEAAVWEAFS